MDTEPTNSKLAFHALHPEHAESRVHRTLFDLLRAAKTVLAALNVPTPSWPAFLLAHLSVPPLLELMHVTI